MRSTVRTYRVKGSFIENAYPHRAVLGVIRLVYTTPQNSFKIPTLSTRVARHNVQMQSLL